MLLVRGLAVAMAAAWLVKAAERTIYWLGGRLLVCSLELDPEFELTQRQYAEVCWWEFPDQPQNLDFEE